MTKVNLLIICIGIYIGICIGIYIQINANERQQNKIEAWYEYRLVVDADNEAELPYIVYDRNGDAIGKITADQLDKIIK